MKLRFPSVIRPRGRHRAVPAPVDMTPLADLLAAGEAEPGEFRYCPEELRSTYHAIHVNGGRRCFTCNTETEAGQ
ncbi:hypothetical protein NLX86_06525 [Streptomyces sp. A3M-1-3]|uniref:hypothetical protein n=1 Tax=Streptomyces sp. A3M-1-3 TaxID=2962044 RepID=UPI0020B6D9E8|nr:hypothetical protein [Streptomyces sp. A3M-1-3]MCP3817801.1 hypothetical protein [Streptomyces sp. A3M-1-3]